MVRFSGLKETVPSMHIAIVLLLFNLFMSTIPVAVLRLLFYRTKGKSQSDCDALCSHQLSCCNTYMAGSCWKGNPSGRGCSLLVPWLYFIALIVATPLTIWMLVLIMMPPTAPLA